MSQLIFHSADVKIPIKERQGFKACILEVFRKEGIKIKRISYIFCSDDYLLQINKKHLNHNFYTDVLTFLLSPNQELIESEIYMSTDRIKENAKVYKASYQKELLRVMIHGALHLCGYVDQTTNGRKLMRQKEDFYIQLYFDSRET